MTLSPRKTYLTPADDAALRETLTEEQIRELDRRLIKVGKDYHVYAAVDAEIATTKSRTVRPTLAKQAINAAASIARTSAGIGRATDEQYRARVDICQQCPCAIMKDGNAYRCGPMFERARANNEPTCGCVLKYKARDIKQDCPQGKWPEIKTDGEKETNPKA